LFYFCRYMLWSSHWNELRVLGGKQFLEGCLHSDGVREWEYNQGSYHLRRNSLFKMLLSYSRFALVTFFMPGILLPRDPIVSYIHGASTLHFISSITKANPTHCSSSSSVLPPPYLDLPSPFSSRLPFSVLQLPSLLSYDL